MRRRKAKRDSELARSGLLKRIRDLRQWGNDWRERAQLAENRLAHLKATGVIRFPWNEPKRPKGGREE